MGEKPEPSGGKPTISEWIAEYYDLRAVREWERMDRHPTEFALTLRALQRYLPPPPARILDCGGGPGRYSIELARMGYQVTLFDLSVENLRFAKVQAENAGVNLAGFERGTATQLDRFSDASFDAVLLMGPLYHLLEEQERRQALSEAGRVARPGGMLFVAFISRYAAFREIARSDPGKLLREASIATRIMETGQLPPRWDQPPEFTAYLAHPREIEPFLRSTGLEVEAVIGVEGLLSMLEEAVNQQTGELWERWVDLNERVSVDPSIHGCVEHLVAVASKPLWRHVLASLAGQLKRQGIMYKVVGAACLALHRVPIRVKEIDLELEASDAYRFQDLFAEQVIEKVAIRESETYRSYSGRFDFSGVRVNVMGDLQRKANDGWIPTSSMTEDIIDVDAIPVRTTWLEEETLANIRHNRMELAVLGLPLCDHSRLVSLLPGQ